MLCSDHCRLYWTLVMVVRVWNSYRFKTAEISLCSINRKAQTKVARAAFASAAMFVPGSAMIACVFYFSSWVAPPGDCGTDQELSCSDRAACTVASLTDRAMFVCFHQPTSYPYDVRTIKKKTTTRCIALGRFNEHQDLFLTALHSLCI